MKYLNYAGYAAIPLAYVVHYLLGRGAAWEPIATFLLAGLGVVPLAHLMGVSTEHLAARTGPAVGGLLNATFGNAAEIIIALIALSKGLTEIVKASLTGSILGNLLLVAGAAMVAGGWNRTKQVFSPKAAEANAGLLAVAVAAMLVPAMFHHAAERLHDVRLAEHELGVSFSTGAILIVVYALSLLFTLRTHAGDLALQRDPATPAPTDPHGSEDVEGEGRWSVGRSVGMLLLAAAGVALVAELLVGSAEQVATRLGWNEVFVGVILLAVIGNAAEHSTAVMLAVRDDMDTAMTIAYQSSLQIALFATPLLVFAAAVMVWLGVGDAQYLNLVFSPLEVVAVALAVALVVVLASNGETNWFEGALLLALYAILAIAFFFIPAGHPGATPDATVVTAPQTASPE